MVSLDRKPENWEQRILLFTGQLIKEKKQSATVKSYISAIKAVLADIDIDINENTCLINSLTRACRLTNDTFRLRLPIQKDLLNTLLQTAESHFTEIGQFYLMKLYTTLLATTYYGLFRVGELTKSDHVVKVVDVLLGVNKKKLMFILRSSKAHDVDKKPQIIKINYLPGKNRDNSDYDNTIIKRFCPYDLLQRYLAVRMEYQNENEQFFIFKDGSAVTPHNFRSTLKFLLTKARFNANNYGTHSLRAGRSVDLMNMGFSIETIKKLGRWTSNSIYRYLKNL